MGPWNLIPMSFQVTKKEVIVCKHKKKKKTKEERKATGI